MTDEERVARYGVPAEDDYWITNFPHWGKDRKYEAEPPVLKSRFFGRVKHDE